MILTDWLRLLVQALTSQNSSLESTDVRMAATAAAAELSAERRDVLAKRRELRKAKKAKGRTAKADKHRANLAKKQEILAKIRAKRDAEQAEKKQRGAGGSYGYGADANESSGGCWLCGESSHRKQDCPNRAAQDLNKTCFQCRRRGHTSQNCPQSSWSAGGSGGNGALVCFNCGSSTHQLRDCREARVGGGASYATCFVCHETGHLSSRCPQSTTGVYPKGGCCKVCKSIEHLARDCPVGNISADGSSSVHANKRKTFADDDDDDNEAKKNATRADADTGGDAWDSFVIPGDDDGGDGTARTSTTKKSKSYKTSGSKRVKF